MNEDLISSHLAALTGNLKASDKSEESALDNIRQIMAGVLSKQDVQSVRNRKFSFETTDLFFRENIETAEQEKMKEAVRLSMKDQSIGRNIRVFVRDVPARSTRIKGSIPDWAAGALLEKTVGPFPGKDGRYTWVDFYRTVEKSVAIYIQGQALPAIIFTGVFKKFGDPVKPGGIGKPGEFEKPGITLKPGIKPQPGLTLKPGAAITHGGVIGHNVLEQVGVNEMVAAGLPGLGTLPAVHEAAKNYTVSDGSVWINARILCATAPADRFCGVRVKGGTIALDASPVVQDDKLVIQAVNNVVVSLNLLQQEAPGPVLPGAHGIDAQNARFNLPEKFIFTFRGLTHSIREIGLSKWTVYGHKASFAWNGDQNVKYDAVPGKVLMPMKCDVGAFEVMECKSPFNRVSGKAAIKESFWGLPAAVLDVSNPMEAYGAGALVIHCGKGLRSHWTPMSGTDARLGAPKIIGEPGRIGISDAASNAEGATHRFDLWQDELNPHGTSADIRYLRDALFFFNTFSTGDEVLLTTCNTDFHTDRPVKVNGEPVAVSSKNSAVVLGANAKMNLMYLYDDNIIWDNTIPLEKVPSQKAMALALDNALFTVSPVNGCLLFGKADENWKKITMGNLWLVFGMYAYLPTLPDPYAANLTHIKRRYNLTPEFDPGRRVISFWLACHVCFKASEEPPDNVTVAFHFSGSPADTQTAGENSVNYSGTPLNQIKPEVAHEVIPHLENQLNPLSMTEIIPGSLEAVIPDYQEWWDKRFGFIGRDVFSLLDVSSNANQLGVSFNNFGGRQMALLPTAVFVPSAKDTTVNNALPFVVEGMEVKSQGTNVQVFTMPAVAWEPVINLTKPDLPAPSGMDPDKWFNYYPDDGGPTRIFNNSKALVALAPGPMVEFLVDEFNNNSGNITCASFTLPFGIKAFALITKTGTESKKPDLKNEQPKFTNVTGGIQVRAIAGNYGKEFEYEPSKNDGRMFPGHTLQLNNILDLLGHPNKTSTLGDSVSRIFNGEFWDPVKLDNRPGVPVEQIDFSGYGTSMFSNWLSPSAQFAQTSQSRFDVITGRTSHEVIQVKSILYPWAIRVVRTITMFRVSSGYVYRYDTGWKAESDGKFDFRYYDDDNNEQISFKDRIHPGIIRGLYNVRNIKEDPGVALYSSSGSSGPVMCRGVWFDADVDIENVVQGHVSMRVGGKQKNLVVSKKILGYVQLAPPGIPLTDMQFKQLLNVQNGSIGGDLDCVIDINNSRQQMRVNRFDVNISADTAGDPVFVAAARGSVLLPKDGSWSVVQHNRGTGDVTPLPEGTSVPLIRAGVWIANDVVDPAAVAKNLLRIANPMELLKTADANTVNLGFLQSTSTQKALFLTPAFKHNEPKLLSKTPPLFADAYRLMTGNGIFPNIGKAAEGDFGKIVPMLTGIDSNSNLVTAFVENGMLDGDLKVLELLGINPGPAGEQGLQLLKLGADGLVDNLLKFDIPDFNIYLVDEDALKIYIEYKTGNKNDPPSASTPGKLDFDVNSAAAALEDTCKSKLNNLAMVVDLGSMTRLMTIKGNFTAAKGQESGYGGSPDGLPVPEIEFSDELQPVIDLLQMLASLSSGDYAAVLQKGLKIAMGNSGEIWEYKFEAKKEIPLIRFPSTDELYNSPSTPLKLEASLALGFYFSAALKATSDASQLVPTAGAYVQFHGGLSVLCMSMGYGSIYAMGSVDVKIACDTLVGPSLTLKFGFGAEIVVGLPVVGHVSIIFMVGVEMYADASKISVTGLLYFRGNAEILGGLVCVTITIEAKGTIERSDDTTSCTAEVTFGLDISIFWIINISFSETWSEQREIA